MLKLKLTKTSMLHVPGKRMLSSSTAPPALSWNDFLALRIRRKRISVVASVGTGLMGGLVGWGLVSNVEIDPTEPIYGFDPLLVYAAGVLVSGGAGYLVGPFLGDAIFKVLLRNKYPQFPARNAEFLQHIRRNRPDASKQSYANPVTDYYGEKIGSLSDYRRWLRDGRAYRQKLEKFL